MVFFTTPACTTGAKKKKKKKKEGKPSHTWLFSVPLFTAATDFKKLYQKDVLSNHGGSGSLVLTVMNVNSSETDGEIL